MQETNTETVVDFTINAMREAIRTGRLVPGQRLVVADITRMFSVSAGPVREAIRRLTGEGLVVIVPHRGAAVRDISIRDIQEIYRVREVIEGLSARLAAERSDISGFRNEMPLIMSQTREVSTVEGWIDVNQRFHDLIYRWSGNERAHALAAQLMLPLFQLRLPHRMTMADVQAARADHELIATAILEADPPRAERTMRNHVRTAAAGLIEAVSDTQADRPRRIS